MKPQVQPRALSGLYLERVVGQLPPVLSHGGLTPNPCTPRTTGRQCRGLPRRRREPGCLTNNGFSFSTAHLQTPRTQRLRRSNQEPAGKGMLLGSAIMARGRGESGWREHPMRRLGEYDDCAAPARLPVPPGSGGSGIYCAGRKQKRAASLVVSSPFLLANSSITYCKKKKQF